MSELYFVSEDGLVKKFVFNYKNHRCMVVSNGRFPRAYIERRHPTEPLDAIECHCGVTFDGKMGEFQSCIGWDYGHAGDLMNFRDYIDSGHEWTVDEIMTEIKEALDGFLNRLADAMVPMLTDGTIVEAEYEELPF